MSSRLLKNVSPHPSGPRARKGIAQNRPINDDLHLGDHFLSLRKEAKRVPKPFFSSLLDIGWIDAHLLVSARLSRCSLWTLDRLLLRVAVLQNGASPGPPGLAQ